MIRNGDSIKSKNFLEWVEVRYICNREGWVEVSDEDDTFREIVKIEDITAHLPLPE